MLHVQHVPETSIQRLKNSMDTCHSYVMRWSHWVVFSMVCGKKMQKPSPRNFSFNPVGIVSSPYRQKFAVPRQPGLVTAATGEILLVGDQNREEALRGLEDFSHLWIIFVFHQNLQQGWKPTVRPPRLGGNKRMGVFATRSPFRPNPIGLSVVELKGIKKQGRQWTLRIAGGDLVDGTPILDIKPYVPYVDAIAGAQGGFTDNSPSVIVPVTFTSISEKQLAQHQVAYPTLKLLIEQVIAQQPQPAYHADNADRVYGMTLYNLNIQWRNDVQGSVVQAITLTDN